MQAVWEFFKVGSGYMTDMTFYRYMLAGFQEEETNEAAACIEAFYDYSEMFNFV